MWAGGKNKMIKQYLETPGIPTNGFDTFVEPFFGGGAMTIWVYENCPEVKRFVINDIKEELVGIYKAIKTDVDNFIKRMEVLQSQYIRFMICVLRMQPISTTGIQPMKVLHFTF
jgi:site-specific DNA-adenine methylase